MSVTSAAENGAKGAVSSSIATNCMEPAYTNILINRAQPSGTFVLCSRMPKAIPRKIYPIITGSV